MTKQTWRAEKLHQANKRREEHQHVEYYASLLRTNKPTVKVEPKTDQESSGKSSLSRLWTCWAFVLTLLAVSQVAFNYDDYGYFVGATTLLGGIGFALISALIVWWLRPEYKLINPWVVYDLFMTGVFIIATIEVCNIMQDSEIIYTSAAEFFAGIGGACILYLLADII